MLVDSVEKPAVYGNKLFGRERERRLGEYSRDALRDDVRLVGARLRGLRANGLGLVVFADDLPGLGDGDLALDVSPRGFDEIGRRREAVDFLESNRRPPESGEFRFPGFLRPQILGKVVTHFAPPSFAVISARTRSISALREARSS